MLSAPAATKGPDTLAVIIPAFNEASSIGAVLDSLRAECGDLITTIIVVDDGSNDDTGAIAEARGATVIRHAANRGYGASLKSGIRSADTTHVATLDADGQHHAADLHRLWQARQRADMVIGARRQLIHSPLWRMPGKWILGAVASYLVAQRIPDLNSGLRLISRPVVMRYMHLCPNGFSMSTTLTLAVLSRGIPVEFVPIDVQRREGKSTVTVATGLATVMLLLRIICLFNPLRLFVPASLAIAAAGFAWAIPYAMAGRGLSVAAMLAMVTAILLFSLGLLCDQISQQRLERYE